MVRFLSSLFGVLLLASCALADSQTCGDSSYSTFSAELQDGQTIESFCGCLQKNLEASKTLQGKPFSCGVNSDVVAKFQLKPSPLPVIPKCPACISNCQDVVGDPAANCAVIKATDNTATSIVVKPVAVALRIRIIIIIVIRPRRVDVYIGIQW